jgi:uncharacterized protein
MNGAKIAVDAAGGAVHLLDDVSWAILQKGLMESRAEAVAALPGFPRHLVQEAWDELDQLKDGGLLFGDEPWRSWTPPEEVPVKALCLNVAQSCNMACKYCFASPYTRAQDLMSLEVALMAVDWLVAHSGSRRHLEIDFFGGEPLLNWKIIPPVVEHARGYKDKVFSFTLTTNGLLLTEDKIDFLNRENIQVVMSLDGRPHIHDAMRPPAGGSYSTYHRVVPRFIQLADSRDHRNYYIRGTYTNANLDFTEDVRHLVELGFREISLEPVVALDGPFALGDEHVPMILQEYERLAEFYLASRREGVPFNFFHFQVDLFSGPCLAKRLTGCGAGYEYLAVTPKGEIYPCHQFIGREGFLMGHVEEGGVDPSITRLFREAHLFNKEGCPDCWARYFCGGGCHANAHLFNGDIHKPHGGSCLLHKKRLECSFYIQSQLWEASQA